MLELTFDLSVLSVRHCGGKLAAKETLTGYNPGEKSELKEKRLGERVTENSAWDQGFCSCERRDLPRGRGLAFRLSDWKI